MVQISRSIPISQAYLPNIRGEFNCCGLHSLIESALSHNLLLLFFRWLFKFFKEVMGQESITNDKLASGRKKWPLKVSIEGNIGCGKSTLINYFKNFPEVDARLVSCRLNVNFFCFYKQCFDNFFA